jgi:hypothetical protein
MVMVVKLSYRPKFLQCYREAKLHGWLFTILYKCDTLRTVSHLHNKIRYVSFLCKRFFPMAFEPQRGAET